MNYDQTHWIPVQRRQPLPTFYYHEHFKEMLDFVNEHYAHVLLDEHIDFIDAFRALPRNAQCLYVRLVNRKGRVFARHRLRYPELGDQAPLFEALQKGGWVASPTVDHYEELLAFLTRSEIYKRMLPEFTGMSRSLKKAQLVDFARSNVDPAGFIAGLDSEHLLVQLRTDEIAYFLFLYFGRARDSLSQFTMRDLGLVRTQTFSDTYEPRFNDRAEALEHFYFATRLKRLERARPDEITYLSTEAADWPAANFPGSARPRDELAYRLGRKAERDGEIERALGLYGKGESAGCSERTVRLLLASDRHDDARRYLERCLDDPRSDGEWLFADDLYARKFDSKRTSVTTDMLRAAESVDIDESRNGSPEFAVVDHFEARGLAAYCTENLVWRTLFGLLFWDELFVDGDTSLHSPFEFLPSSLQDGTFYEKNTERIESQFASLHDPARAKRGLLKTSTEHYGTPNGVFRWRESMNDAVFALLDHAPVDAIETILRRFCRDYTDSRYGYPDVMVIDADGVRFIEVKAEGDQLRRNQLLRLRQLREAGFRADVLRVRWVLDPQQTYVVVDVETTGGNGERHRVTEIGAVKLRDGQVIDRFQTLLNPQRSIPANIQRLTGISAAMVEDAPYFSDIAEDFEAFLEDSIFVAHNVEFDYGFIAREFGRIGRAFRYPKLCTCTSMRKLYPGQRSYSLASLCRSFDIPLKQHHRALCDAEAAAELLLLINEKRPQTVAGAHQEPAG